MKYLLWKSTLSPVFVTTVFSLNVGPTPSSDTDMLIGSFDDIGARAFLSIRTNSLAANNFA